MNISTLRHIQKLFPLEDPESIEKEIAEISANKRLRLRHLRGGKMHSSIRKKVRERDKQCLECGGNERLTIHHINHSPLEPLDHSLDNLELLCRDCHNKRHLRID